MTQVRLESNKNPGLRLLGQTFPSRTEGSVKKHWYKVRLLVLKIL